MEQAASPRVAPFPTRLLGQYELQRGQDRSLRIAHRKLWLVQWERSWPRRAGCFPCCLQPGAGGATWAPRRAPDTQRDAEALGRVGGRGLMGRALRAWSVGARPMYVTRSPCWLGCGPRFQVCSCMQKLVHGMYLTCMFPICYPDVSFPARPSRLPNSEGRASAPTPPPLPPGPLRHSLHAHRAGRPGKSGRHLSRLPEACPKAWSGPKGPVGALLGSRS